LLLKGVKYYEFRIDFKPKIPSNMSIITGALAIVTTIDKGQKLVYEIKI